MPLGTWPDSVNTSWENVYIFFKALQKEKQHFLHPAISKTPLALLAPVSFSLFLHEITSCFTVFNKFYCCTIIACIVFMCAMHAMILNLGGSILRNGTERNGIMD